MEKWKSGKAEKWEIGKAGNRKTMMVVERLVPKPLA